MQQFVNRRQAGRRLAEELSEYAQRDDVIVLALPRGGVPVGYEVAVELGVPLDIFLVRKLGVPGREELAMGAIASGGGRFMNERVLDQLRISEEDIEEVERKERQELERREEEYRPGRPPPEVERKTVILVDDGLATGASMKAAVRALRERKPGRIVVAVGTAPADTVREFRDEVDEVVCLTTPAPFFGVGGSYRDFSQTTDREVKELLERAAEETG